MQPHESIESLAWIPAISVLPLASLSLLSWVGRLRILFMRNLLGNTHYIHRTAQVQRILSCFSNFFEIISCSGYKLAAPTECFALWVLIGLYLRWMHCLFSLRDRWCIAHQKGSHGRENFCADRTGHNSHHKNGGCCSHLLS